MTPIAWDVDGCPVPQGSLRAYMAGGRPILTYGNREPLSVWRDQVRAGCPIVDPDPGPWRVTVTFRLSRPAGHYGAHGVLPRYAGARPATRPDLDKLVRAVMDALTMRVWRDDAQVVSITASKRYSDTPGATIVVTKEELQ